MLTMPLSLVLPVACKTTEADPSDATQDCIAAFPPGEWRSLLGGSTGNGNPDAFRELQEGNKSPGGWVQEGPRLVSKAGPQFQSLVSKCAFRDFELEFDWIISSGGNSGIKYLVSVHPGPRFARGFEYQIVDDALHPDARAGDNRKAAALYDLIAPVESKKLNPAGEVNTSRIVLASGKGEHWLNGTKVLSFDKESKDFTSVVAKSKFKAIAGFASAQSGHILIQHHDDRVEFLKLRIKPGQTR